MAAGARMDIVMPKAGRNGPRKDMYDPVFHTLAVLGFVSLYIVSATEISLQN